ncbi:MAG TPA: electron transfer flavoprotein subunit alpha/FixB family protein [Tissierellaceae bacterium]|jgi:electron transfer flavoprotein alpha subunit|nr:electron transfer flavoprotein subunit alpha/FixB family protein [Tissierellaceae bacterium]
MNIAEYKDIYVFCEERENKIHDSSLELLGEAVRLVKDRPSLNYKVVGVVIGDHSDELAELAGYYGADRVIFLHNENLKHYSTEIYTELFMDVIKNDKPDIILIPATVLGRDLAPRIAARCDTGLTADATKLDFDPENEDSALLYVTRPAFGGNLFGTIINETKRPQMTTIRPGVMEPIHKDTEREFHLDKREVSIDHIEDKVKLIEVLQKDNMAVDITKADIILSGGRGIGDNFHVLEECAKMIGAEVGASRGAVDKGFIGKDHQVGQTGKTVRPKVYIACGISGAVQHLAGMEKSDYIIAINKDPEAAIFSVANIGLVGDALEILPLLTEEIKTYRERPY